MPDLSVEFAGLKFKNPIFAASGAISDCPENIEKCCLGGAGAVICKTVTSFPELRVYPRPHDFALDKFGQGLRYTALGAAKLFADEGPEEWAKEVLPRALEICDKHGVVYIQSILGDGKDIDSWVYMAQLMEANGAYALEINFSCPHSSAIIPNTGASLGMNPENASEVAAAVCKSVKIPVFAKMTSRNEEVDLVAAACTKAGVAGISVFNNPVGLWVDVENQSHFGIPAMAWGWGGRFMQPIALYKAAKIHKNPDVTVPVYGGTGVWTWDDALRFILLGNHAVQMHISVMHKGYGLFKELTDGIEEYMERKGIANLEEIRGKVLPEIVNIRTLKNDDKGEVIISVDEEKCNGCGRCKACMWSVLEVQEGKAKIVALEKCHGCGWCTSFCEKKALSVVRKSGELIINY